MIVPEVCCGARGTSIRGENTKKEWGQRDRDEIWIVGRVLYSHVAVLKGNRREKEPRQDGLQVLVVIIEENHKTVKAWNVVQQWST